MWMALKLWKTDEDLYEAHVTPPHVEVAWATLEPISVKRLVKELKARGCHPQDIGEALHEHDRDRSERLLDHA